MAVAAVDPGNVDPRRHVAANITSGARYGYLLVWVLVLANAMSVLIQYQSAKLGIVTNKSLPELLGERMSDAAFSAGRERHRHRSGRGVTIACHRCSSQPRSSRNHLDFHCSSAVW